MTPEISTTAPLTDIDQASLDKLLTTWLHTLYNILYNILYNV